MNFLFNFNPIYKCNLTKQTLDFWILCDTKIVSGILILLNSLNSFEVSILSNVTMFSYVFVVSNLLTLSQQLPEVVILSQFWILFVIKFSLASQCCLVNVVNVVSLLNIVCHQIYSGISMHRNYNLSNILLFYYILVLSIVLTLSNFANIV